MMVFASLHPNTLNWFLQLAKTLILLYAYQYFSRLPCLYILEVRKTYPVFPSEDQYVLPDFLTSSLPVDWTILLIQFSLKLSSCNVTEGGVDSELTDFDVLPLGNTSAKLRPFSSFRASVAFVERAVQN